MPSQKLFILHFYVTLKNQESQTAIFKINKQLIYQFCSQKIRKLYIISVYLQK
ncbi:hypothetical protein pb186bvf_004127 [Paramecium bursaria]